MRFSVTAVVALGLALCGAARATTHATDQSDFWFTPGESGWAAAPEDQAPALVLLLRPDWFPLPLVPKPGAPSSPPLTAVALPASDLPLAPLVAPAV